MSKEKGPYLKIVDVSLFINLIPVSPRQLAVPEIARANRSTSGTGYWPTTLTMTAPGSSWIGFSFPPAVSAGI